MFRTLLMLAFWAVSLPIAAVLGFPWTYLTKDISFLYNTCMSAMFTGVRIAGVTRLTVGGSGEIVLWDVPRPPDGAQGL